MKHNFRELKIWQKSRILVKEIYIATLCFPDSEIYGLQNQARRAAVSIVANIAEGSGKGTNKDFNNFLNIAKGSLFELQTHLILSNDLDFLKTDTFNSLMLQTEELVKMLVGFQAKLDKKV